MGESTIPGPREHMEGNQEQGQEYIDARKEVPAILGVRLAPVNIPWVRRLQTASVLFWMSWFLYSSTLGVILLLSLLYSRLWPLALAYLAFMVWDWDTMHSGGRQDWTVSWCRRWSLWRHFADFFPITIVKTAELDPSCNYLMCSHPHGVLCTGAVAVFATEGAGFKETFPGIEPHLLTLEAQFKLPLHRELILSLGACAASKRGIGSLLQREKGVAAVLVPGGARESMNGEKDRITLVLNRRKGFIKLALEHGVSLVPTFSFGEQYVYNLAPNPPGSLLRKIQTWFLAKTGVPLLFFLGRGVFQYSIGYVPNRTPIHVVVGAPIKVTKTPNPTTEEVDSLHSQYVEALTGLYREHSPKYGPGVELVVG